MGKGQCGHGEGIEVKLLAVLLASTFAVPAIAQSAPAASDRQSVEAQIKELRAMRDSLATQMNTFDGKIIALENQLQASLPAQPATAPTATPKPAPVATASAAPAAPAVVTGAATAAAVAPAAPGADAIKVAARDADVTNDAYLFKPKTWGVREPGKGFVVARTDTGELDVTLVTYFRYLNQMALKPDYTLLLSARPSTLDLNERFHPQQGQSDLQGLAVRRTVPLADLHLDQQFERPRRWANLPQWQSRL
jgi:hypothetical protein